MISYKLKNKPFIIGSFLPFVSCHTIFLKKSPINHIRYYQFIGLFSTINIDTHKCDGFVLDIQGTGNADFKWFGMSGKYAPVVHLKDGTVVSIDDKTSDLSV